MKFKINGRVFLGVSILLLLALVVAGLGITYRSGTVHASGNSLIMPWEPGIHLTGTDYVAYLCNTLQGAYAQYPWVVQVSYLIVLLCVLGVILLAGLMGWDIYRRKRDARLFHTLESKYYGILKGIADADHLLSQAELYARIAPESVSETSEAFRMQWIELFILLRADTDMKEPAATNIRHAMEMLGLNEFMEHRLTYGADKEKLRVIQAARLLDMQLPDSVMATIVNNRDVRLHKAARFYYMLINRDDPYLYFENEKMNDPFTVWDRLELHQLFKDCHDAGKRLPSFIPLIRQLSNPEIAAFFIRETAYWGSDAEVGYLVEYFDAPDQRFRKAAFEGMGLRRYAAAEEPMKACFFNQSEPMRRIILESLLAIGSGKSVDFIREAFYASASRFTKRTALRCLWRYNDEGRAVVREMRSRAAADERLLFEQLDNDNLLQHTLQPEPLP